MAAKDTEPSHRRTTRLVPSASRTRRERLMVAVIVAYSVINFLIQSVIQPKVMADTLTERITGQARATDVNVQVQVVVPVEALVDPDSPLPAEIPGHGPVPVSLLATTAGKKA